MRRRRSHLGGGAVLVLFAIACLGCFVFLFNLAGGLGRPGAERYQAVVRDAVLLADRADVRIAGVTKGRVEKLAVRRGLAVLELSIDDDVAIHRDATVRIGTKTPTGENYVDLVPGTTASPRVAPGETLGVSRAREAVQLDEILSEFDEPRRLRVRRLLRGIGTGVKDGGEGLDETLEGLSALFVKAGPLTETLAAQREQVAGLVDDLGATFAALGERDSAVQALVHESRRAADAVAAEDEALRATLRRLPATLQQARTTATTLGAVGTRITPVLDDLRATLGGLTPTVARLPVTARRTQDALDALSDATPPAVGALAATRRTAPGLTALAEPLDDVLRETLPMLEYNAPYGADLARGFSNIGAIAQERDEVSHFVRLTAVITEGLYQALPVSAQKVVDDLTKVGALRLVNSEFNASPRPGIPFGGTPDDVKSFRRLTREERPLP